MNDQYRIDKEHDDWDIGSQSDIDFWIGRGVLVPVEPDYEAAWKMMQSIDDSMGLMKPTRPEALKMVVDAALGGTDE